MLRAHKTPIFAEGQKLTHCPANEEKHAGQETPLLYTPYLQWHHPGGRALLQLAQAPTQDYHSHTHALLGVVADQVVSPNDPPVKGTRGHSSAKQLWPNRDAKTRFPARAWRERVLLLRAQRGCRRSRTALTTPGGAAVNCLCDQRPRLAGQEKNGTLLHQSPYLPTCKAKANEGVFAAEEPSQTPRIIRLSV